MNVTPFVPKHASARLRADDESLKDTLRVERAVLGSVLVDGECFAEVKGEGLTAEDFYSEKHRKCWAAFEALAALKVVPDIVTLHQRLKLLGTLDDVGGIAFLSGLTNEHTTAAYATSYAKQVLDMSLRRQLAQTLQEGCLELHAVDSAGELAADLMGKIGALQSRSSQRLTVKGALRGLATRVEQAQDPEAPRAPILGMGISALDASLGGGAFAGEYVVIAGCSSNGKSICAKQLSILSQTAAHGSWWCDYYSTELADRSKFDNILAQFGGFRMRSFFNDLRSQGDSKYYGAFIDAVTKMRSWDLEIESGRHVSAAHICARARQRKRQEAERAFQENRPIKAGVVIVDYLQAINLEGIGKNKGKPEGLKDASALLCDLAHQEGLLVIVTAQAPQEVNKAQRAPGPLEVEWSSGVWQDADMALSVFWPYNYDKRHHPQEYYLNVTKSREGETGRFLARFRTDLGGELQDPGAWSPPPVAAPETPKKKRSGGGW